MISDHWDCTYLVYVYMFDKVWTAHSVPPNHVTANYAEVDELGKMRGEVIMCTCVFVCVCLIPADQSNCDVELYEETYLGIWDSHSDLLPAG